MIRGNLNRIAQTLVLSLTDYFGIPFVSAAEPFYGTTETGGARLNLRDYPALNGKILTQIPDGTLLILYGETDGWFVTEYNGVTGYVSEEYIRLS